MKYLLKAIAKEKKREQGIFMKSSRKLRALCEAESALLSNGVTKIVRAEPGPKMKIKHKMSAAGRKAIGDATRKRWAEFHKKNGKS